MDRSFNTEYEQDESTRLQRELRKKLQEVITDFGYTETLRQMAQVFFKTAIQKPPDGSCDVEASIIMNIADRMDEASDELEPYGV